MPDKEPAYVIASSFLFVLSPSYGSWTLALLPRTTRRQRQAIMGSPSARQLRAMYMGGCFDPFALSLVDHFMSKAPMNEYSMSRRLHPPVLEDEDGLAKKVIDEWIKA
ncbi:hypothetical protein ANO11243_067290 [Dothideomycetidae sp. 11243]|nr:hypothetical protein ANO11243_067290 [fungal sp. No.11243]